MQAALSQSGLEAELSQDPRQCYDLALASLTKWRARSHGGGPAVSMRCWQGVFRAVFEMGAKEVVPKRTVFMIQSSLFSHYSYRNPHRRHIL